MESVGVSTVFVLGILLTALEVKCSNFGSYEVNDNRDPPTPLEVNNEDTNIVNYNELGLNEIKRGINGKPYEISKLDEHEQGRLSYLREISPNSFIRDSNSPNVGIGRPNEENEHSKYQSVYPQQGHAQDNQNLHTVKIHNEGRESEMQQQRTIDMRNTDSDLHFLHGCKNKESEACKKAMHLLKNIKYGEENNNSKKSERHSYAEVNRREYSRIGAEKTAISIVRQTSNSPIHEAKLLENNAENKGLSNENMDTNQFNDMFPTSFTKLLKQNYTNESEEDPSTSVNFWDTSDEATSKTTEMYGKEYTETEEMEHLSNASDSMHIGKNPLLEHIVHELGSLWINMWKGALDLNDSREDERIKNEKINSSSEEHNNMKHRDYEIENKNKSDGEFNSTDDVKPIKSKDNETTDNRIEKMTGEIMHTLWKSVLNEIVNGIHVYMRGHSSHKQIRTEKHAKNKNSTRFADIESLNSTLKEEDKLKTEIGNQSNETKQHKRTYTRKNEEQDSSTTEHRTTPSSDGSVSILLKRIFNIIHGGNKVINYNSTTVSPFVDSLMKRVESASDNETLTTIRSEINSAGLKDNNSWDGVLRDLANIFSDTENVENDRWENIMHYIINVGASMQSGPEMNVSKDIKADSSNSHETDIGNVAEDLDDLWNRAVDQIGSEDEGWDYIKQWLLQH